MTLDINKLNQQFGIHNSKGFIRFKSGSGGIPVVEIKNSQARASISLQGAHLLNWVCGDDDIIWISEDARFEVGKSVRGGIPICWPWFGAHSSDLSCPAHGFARCVLWQVTATQQLTSDETLVTFKLETQQLAKKFQQMWSDICTLEYSLSVGKKLKLELTTCNNSKNRINITQALHSYFNIGDIRETMVSGLEGREYLDKPDNFKRKMQTGPITIKQEIDRIYLHTVDDIIIDNKNRKIIIKKQGSQTTVVWNPGQQLAQKMGDLGEHGYLSMLCVESANAAQDVVSIKPGGSHTLQAVYEIEAS